MAIIQLLIDEIYYLTHTSSAIFCNYLSRLAIVWGYYHNLCASPIFAWYLFILFLKGYRKLACFGISELFRNFGNG
jgi:hypothetical protein